MMMLLNPAHRWLILVLCATCGSLTLFSPQAVALPESMLTALSEGKPQQVILLFDDQEVAIETQRRLDLNKSSLETASIIAYKAARYGEIKAAVLDAPTSPQVRQLHEYSHLPLAHVELTSTLALQALQRDPRIVAVYPNQAFKLHLNQSAPLIAQPETLLLGQQGEGVTVAVMDTGADYTHSAFGSCTAPGSPASCQVAVAMDFAPEDGQLDDNGHGTNVAGIVVGIAPKSRIAVLDVFDGSTASSSDIIDAYNWVIANRDAYNIVAVNLSLGDGSRYTSPCSSVLSNVFLTPISNARSAGILTVASSGNEAYTDGMAMPACTPGAISVGAVYDSNVGGVGYSNCSDSTTAANQVTCFSNSASFLSVLAPGALITAAGSTSAGTSQAAPHVSGLIALLRGAHVSESVSQTESRLLSTGVQVTDSRNGLSHPRIHSLDAINQGTADLEISGLASADPVSLGATLVYTFTLANQGPETANAPVLQDDLPSEVSFVSASAGCSEAAGQVTCNLADLSPGAHQVVSITVTPVAGASILNTASISSGTPDIHADNDAVTLTTAVSAVADLSLSLSASDDPAPLGETLSYLIDVDNLGPSMAVGVTLSDLLAGSVSFLSVSSGCSESAGTVTCLLGDIPSGDSRSIQIDVTTTATGAISNSAQVDSSASDPTTGNNSVQLTTRVINLIVDDEAEVPFLPLWAVALLGGGLLSLGWRSGRNKT
jgi:uncharacterized repeat protein (TIGR01451 family)